MSDIREFQITWKGDLFFKHKSTLTAANRSIKKSVVIAQARLYRRVNSLKNELHTVEQDREILKSSLAEHLQQRLQTLQNEIDDYNRQIQTRTEREREYWKHLASIIEKRTKCYRSTEPPATIPPADVNKTYVTHTETNNENVPPSKASKSRKKKKKEVR